MLHVIWECDNKIISQSIWGGFESNYLMQPLSMVDVIKKMRINGNRIFYRMFMYLDYMHWDWGKCLVHGKDSFKIRWKQRQSWTSFGSNSKSITMHSHISLVYPMATMIWMCFIGFLLGRFNNMHKAINLEFTINEFTCMWYYYLIDNTYTKWSFFI